MRISLSIKLGIGVILLFAVVVGVCVAWTPVRVSMHRAALKSEDFSKRFSSYQALYAIGDKGRAEVRAGGQEPDRAYAAATTTCLGQTEERRGDGKRPPFRGNHQFADL